MELAGTKRNLLAIGDVVKNPEADKFYSVLEGKGIVPAEQIRPGSHAH